MKGYIPELYSALGVFLSLITVNCIILGRAEAFASKNKIFPSILDGLGMGLGFTLSLFTMGSIREILGTGSWFGFKIPFLCDDPMTVFIMPAGGFFVLGCLIALVNKIANKKPPRRYPAQAAQMRLCARVSAEQRVRRHKNELHTYTYRLCVRK